MNPLLLAALGQGGAALLSPLFQQEVQPANVNPLTAPFLQDLQNQMQQLQAQINQQQQSLEQTGTQQARSAQAAGQIAEQAQEVQAPGPNEWFKVFLGNVPEYQAIAQQTADQATQIAGRSGEEQAQRLSQQAARTTAEQFAGSGAGFSGAAQQAVGEAAINPLAQFQSNLAQSQANVFSSGLNQLLGQGQGLAQASQQQAFNNQLQALSQALQGQQVAGGLYGQQAQTQLGQQNILSQLLGQNQAQQAQIAAPVFSTPDYYNPLDRISGAFGLTGQLLSNPQITGGLG